MIQKFLALVWKVGTPDSGYRRDPGSGIPGHRGGSLPRNQTHGPIQKPSSFKENLRKNLLTFGFKPLINLGRNVNAHNQVDYGKAGEMPVVRKAYDVQPDKIAEHKQHVASEKFATTINKDLGWDIVPEYIAAKNDKAFYEFIPGLKTLGQYLNPQFPPAPVGRDLENYAKVHKYFTAVKSVFLGFMKTVPPEVKLYAEKVATIDDLIHNHDRHYNNVGLTFDKNGAVAKFHAIDNEDGLYKDSMHQSFNTYFANTPISDTIHKDLINLKNKLDSSPEMQATYRSVVGRYYDTFYKNLDEMAMHKMHLLPKRIGEG